MSKPGVSIIICCHNSKDRIKPTLTHIGRQDLLNLKVEIILVDNASTDDTARYGKKIWENLGNPFPLKLLYEPNPGLSNARFKGLDNAEYDYILFCDDDNWLKDDYITTGINIIESNPCIGMLGGRGIAESEKERPDWFEKFSGLYAVGAQAPKSGDISFAKGYVYGAGAFINKKALASIRRSDVKLLLSDRKGDKLTSGGDNEIGYLLVFAGYKIVYDDRLTFKHFIPEFRLKLSYLKKMRKSYAASFDVIRAYQTLLLSNGDKRRTEKKRYQEHIHIFKKLIKCIYLRLTGRISKTEFIFTYYAYFPLILNGLKNWRDLNRKEDLIYQNFKILKTQK